MGYLFHASAIEHFVATGLSDVRYSLTETLPLLHAAHPFRDRGPDASSPQLHGPFGL